MWHWDQGRLGYFEFDAVRRIAAFVVLNDAKHTDLATIVAATGMPFKPIGYQPWRNYARVMKLCLLVAEVDDHAVPTTIATCLASPGATTCDEYVHFLAQATTEPSPALSDYNAQAKFRYPLLFALKYLLAKVASKKGDSARLFEIMEAYSDSNLTGEEDQIPFLQLLEIGYDGSHIESDKPIVRQARESLLVLSQISYLLCDGDKITVSLDPVDAEDIFLNMHGITGPFAEDADEEIQRRASLFASTETTFDYPSTSISDAVESGFAEGSKVRKTHITIERNAKLRSAFFRQRPTATCDVCRLLTDKTYPWVQRVLDLHHLMPLSSGTRVDTKVGTVLDDLVPVCPTCHRAVHRYYDVWLRDQKRMDFSDRAEATHVYGLVKKNFAGNHFA